jgi:hypothetical protein
MWSFGKEGVTKVDELKEKDHDTGNEYCVGYVDSSITRKRMSDESKLGI